MATVQELYTIQVKVQGDQEFKDLERQLEQLGVVTEKFNLAQKKYTTEQEKSSAISKQQAADLKAQQRLRRDEIRAYEESARREKKIRDDKQKVIKDELAAYDEVARREKKIQDDRMRYLADETKAYEENAKREKRVRDNKQKIIKAEIAAYDEAARREKQIQDNRMRYLSDEVRAYAENARRERAILEQQEQARSRASAQAVRDANEVARAQRRSALEINNAGFQVTDFIVQVQGGQDAMRAFGQQAPQFLGAFQGIATKLGAWGAVIGVAAALAPTLIEFFRNTKKEAEFTSDAISDLTGNIRDFTDSIRNQSIDSIIEQFGQFNEVTERSAAVFQEYNRGNLLEGFKAQLEAATESVDDFKYSFALQAAKDSFAPFLAYEFGQVATNIKSAYDSYQAFNAEASKINVDFDDLAGTQERIADAIEQIDAGAYGDVSGSIKEWKDQLIELSKATSNFQRLQVQRQAPTYEADVKAINNYIAAIEHGNDVNLAKASLDAILLQNDRERRGLLKPQIEAANAMADAKERQAVAEKKAADDLKEAQRYQTSTQDLAEQITLESKRIVLLQQGVAADKAAAIIEAERFKLQLEKEGKTQTEINLAIQLNELTAESTRLAKKYAQALIDQKKARQDAEAAAKRIEQLKEEIELQKIIANFGKDGILSAKEQRDIEEIQFALQLKRNKVVGEEAELAWEVFRAKRANAALDSKGAKKGNDNVKSLEGELLLLEEQLIAIRTTNDLTQTQRDFQRKMFIEKSTLEGKALAESIARYDIQVKINDATKKQLDQQREFEGLLGNIKKINGAFETQQDKVEALADLINKYQSRMSEEQWQAALDALENLREQVDSVGFAAKTSFVNNMSSAFDSIIDGTAQAKDAFADMAKGILADIAKLYVQMKIIGPLMQSLGLGNPYATEADAYGAVLGGSLKAHALGSVVRTPTILGRHLMADNGPEAIMPLRRLSDGRLGIEATGGETVVNVINNSGAQASVSERETAGGGREIDVLIEQTVQRQMAGGNYDRTLSTVFGLQRRGQGGR